ncbi:MAG: 3-oxo-5-alpha-steroid 4-dehydrogenase [Pseudomonadota bacterium]
MPEFSLYQWTSFSLIAIGVLVAISLIFVTAPYGRYDRKGWGPEMDERFGWMLMEAISPLFFLIAFFWAGGGGPVGYWLLLLFCGHYVYRSFIYPFRMRGHGTKPVATVLMAAAFNVANGSVNGWGVAMAGHLDESWVSSPWLWIGTALFALGVFVNHQSDGILRTLRGPGETGYKIPHGGMFRFVSSPNYLGEIVQWIGFAIAACTLGALSFAIFTASNIGPRAFSHHAWYRRTFSDYPQNRKALIPFIA